MNFTLAELTRIKLEPGEVLSVKLYGDDYDETIVSGLQDSLQKNFPNNKVMIFALPPGNDLQMEAVSGSLRDNEIGELKTKHQEEKLELLAQIKALSNTTGA